MLKASTDHRDTTDRRRRHRHKGLRSAAPVENPACSGSDDFRIVQIDHHAAMTCPTRPLQAHTPLEECSQLILVDVECMIRFVSCPWGTPRSNRSTIVLATHAANLTANCQPTNIQRRRK